MTREEALTKALEIVTGARQQEYGGPEDSFAMIAEFWSTYLQFPVSAEDVAAMMGLLKLARLAGSECKSIDSWVDLIGYAACGVEIAAGGGPGEEG